MNISDEEMSERINQHIDREVNLKLERLRDEFAMAALNGLLSGNFRFQSFNTAARESYEAADAMLYARTKS